MADRIFHDEERTIWTASELPAANGAVDRQGRRITPVDGFSPRLVFSSAQGVVLMRDAPPNWRDASDAELLDWLKAQQRTL
jgi:hypothetical protein